MKAVTQSPIHHSALCFGRKVLCQGPRGERDRPRGAPCIQRAAWIPHKQTGHFSIMCCSSLISTDFFAHFDHFPHKISSRYSILLALLIIYKISIRPLIIVSRHFRSISGLCWVFLSHSDTCAIANILDPLIPDMSFLILDVVQNTYKRREYPEFFGAWIVPLNTAWQYLIL